MLLKDLKIKEIAVAGGVSANTGLRNAFHDHARRFGWKIYIPKFSYTTDNAAMIGAQAYYEYLAGNVADMSLNAYATKSILGEAL